MPSLLFPETSCLLEMGVGSLEKRAGPCLFFRGVSIVCHLLMVTCPWSLCPWTSPLPLVCPCKMQISRSFCLCSPPPTPIPLSAPRPTPTLGNQRPPSSPEAELVCGQYEEGQEQGPPAAVCWQAHRWCKCQCIEALCRVSVVIK